MAGQASVPRKVVINQHVVVDLAIHGPIDRAKMLLAETTRTMDRLGLNLSGVRRGFRSAPRGVGDHPCIHDIMRWLDDIKITDFYTEEVKFLRKLQKTLLNRFSK